MARALIIEDDPATAAELAKTLARHGHEVKAVHDGVAGLARARSGNFDVITLDRMLPGLDVLSIVELLRQGSVARRSTRS